MAKLTFMETYRSGHNGPDSKSVGRLLSARGFESLRLRFMEPAQSERGMSFNFILRRLYLLLHRET